MNTGRDAERIVRATGRAVSRVRAIGGAHRWRYVHARLDDGREVFAKVAERAAGGPLAAEAAGLRWLRAANAVPVPAVLGHDDAILVLPWLRAETPTAAAASRFGRELAAMHAAGADTFGVTGDAPRPPGRETAGFIASLPLDNTPPGPGERWPRWYARRRLLPYLRRAVDGGSLRADEAGVIDRVIDRIDTLAGPDEPPARIHGDLWAGNLLWSGGGVYLIDPAAHGGHRETDLAMLDLFGAPHLDRIVAGYQEVAPLPDGRRARLPLHQLHPLLVHVCLFGAGYRAQTLAAARAALRAG